MRRSTDGTPCKVGEIGNVQRRGSGYTCELRGLMQKLQNNIGNLVTPSCNAKLGDARCGVDLDALTITSVAVTDVNSRGEFEASSLGQDNGYFVQGDVRWLTGLNARHSSTVRAPNSASSRSISTRTTATRRGKRPAHAR